MKIKWKQPIPEAAKKAFAEEARKKKSIIRSKLHEKYCPNCKTIYDASKGQSRCFICFNKLPKYIK